MPTLIVNLLVLGKTIFLGVVFNSLVDTSFLGVLKLLIDIFIGFLFTLAIGLA